MYFTMQTWIRTKSYLFVRSSTAWKDSSLCKTWINVLRISRSLSKVSSTLFYAMKFINKSRFCSELIFQLIQKWQFDHKSLIINEAKEDFNAVYFPPPSTVYGPPAFVPNLVQNNDGGYHYPEPIYIPKPPQTFPEQGKGLLYSLIII